MNYKEILAENRFLETNRLILRPVGILDSMTIFDYGKDRLATKYLNFKNYESPEQALEVIVQFLMEPGFYLVEEKETKTGLGLFTVEADQNHDKVIFGFVFKRSCWNKGYGTEALKRILEFSFESLGVNKVEATCAKENCSSRRVMEKCGLSLEGTRPQSEKWQGEYVDICMYGILKSEYLNPKNLE